MQLTQNWQNMQQHKLIITVFSASHQQQTVCQPQTACYSVIQNCNTAELRLALACPIHGKITSVQACEQSFLRGVDIWQYAIIITWQIQTVSKHVLMADKLTVQKQ